MKLFEVISRSGTEAMLILAHNADEALEIAGRERDYGEKGSPEGLTATELPAGGDGVARKILHYDFC